MSVTERITAAKVDREIVAVRNRRSVMTRLGVPRTSEALLDALQRDLGSEWTRAGLEGVLAQLRERGEVHRLADGRWAAGGGPRKGEADLSDGSGGPSLPSGGGAPPPEPSNEGPSAGSAATGSLSPWSGDTLRPYDGWLVRWEGDLLRGLRPGEAEFERVVGGIHRYEADPAWRWNVLRPNGVYDSTGWASTEAAAKSSAADRVCAMGAAFTEPVEPEAPGWCGDPGLDPRRLASCPTGPEFKVWREARGLSQAEVARELRRWLPHVRDVSGSLSPWERGRDRGSAALRAAVVSYLGSLEPQPSEPARAPESSPPEETPARASVVAAQPSSGEQGGVASPGAGAPQAADRTREPELGGASPPPAAEPCSPLSRPSGDSSTAAPAADRADLRADREGDEPGVEEYARALGRVMPWLWGLGPLPVVRLMEPAQSPPAYGHAPDTAYGRVLTSGAGVPFSDGVHYSTGNCFGAEHGYRFGSEAEVDWPRHVRDAYQRVAELEQEVAQLRAQHDSERERADTADAITRATLETLRGYDDEIARLRSQDGLGAFDRAVAAEAEVERLREQSSAHVFRWGRAEHDLGLVGETLDRIGVPAGSLAWRLGWLEGRELGRGGGR